MVVHNALEGVLIFACHSITSILLPENDRKLLTKETILGE